MRFGAVQERVNLDSLQRGTGRRILARRVLRYLPALSLLTLAIVAWQVFAVLWQVPDYLLPAPDAIWRATLDERDLLITNTVPTLEIAVFGFFLAFGLALILAIGIHLSRLVELTLYPLLIASQSVPLIALAPILVILLGYTILPKLVMVCLICFFPMVVNAADGFKSVDPDLRNLLRTLGATRLRLFRDVELPSALPYIFSGAKVAAAYAVVGAIVGEWVGSSEGLGYLMIQKQAQFDTAVVFSAMAILTVMGIGLFVAVSVAERLLMPWYQDEKRRDSMLSRRR